MGCYVHILQIKAQHLHRAITFSFGEDFYFAFQELFEDAMYYNTTVTIVAEGTNGQLAKMRCYS